MTTNERLPARHSNALYQGWLFSSTLSEVLVEESVTSDELICWHRRGWLSFDPLEVAEFGKKERLEIRFVKGTTRAWLSEDASDRLLGLLPKPFCYDPDDTFFSFLDDCWITVPGDPDPAVVAREYIEGLIASEKWDELREMQVSITKALDEAEEGSE